MFVARQRATLQNIMDLSPADVAEAQDDEQPVHTEESFNMFSTGVGAIDVHGAGLSDVNGTYVRDSTFDGVSKYVKEGGSWNGTSQVFSLFRCSVSGGAKWWFISIVHPRYEPGTTCDIDFYSAPMSETEPEVPPSFGWIKGKQGVLPPPKIFTGRYDG